MQKIHFFDLFILHRFYSKFILIYSRFYISSMSNFITHKSSLLKKENTVTIRTCLYLNSLNQVYLNYPKFNVYLDYSNLKLHLNYSAFKFYFNFRHSDFHLNYSITALDLMFKKSNVEYRVLKISVR